MTKLLAELKAEGTATVYSQWMKSTKGRQFCISNGLMWNIETATGLQGPHYFVGVWPYFAGHSL